MKMLKNVFWVLLIFSGVLFSYDFKVTIVWDEMAMMGDAEGIIQYYSDGKVEAIRGNLYKTSTDQNVRVLKKSTGGKQEFVIEKAKGKLINIWIANSVMDEDFATKEDFLMLANSKTEIWIEDRLNGKSHKVKIPPKTPGLIFRAGAIVDGSYYDFLEMFEKQRIYNVTMTNAVNNKLLSGVSVNIQNIKTGETVAVGETDEYGYFAQKLDYGVYEAKFSKKGYSTVAHPFQMDLTELPVSMNFSMAPHIKKYRIVLTWGPFPKDLDAHLAGPIPSGGEFHIWWQQKTLIAGKNFLDIDDRNQYGPETITIYKPAAGIYEYAVHNYSDRNRYGSKHLSMSGARVDVYADGKLQSSFSVPFAQKGNVWKVFRMDQNQQIIPINALYDENISAKVMR
jgi:hypothetical protein